MACYSGPANTQGVGPCKGGMATCDAQGTSYGPCAGEVTPKPENCATAADDDCSGAAAPACSGAHLWSKGWGGPLDDEGVAVATDPSGNVLFGGYFDSAFDYGCGTISPNAIDTLLLIKLDPNGNCLFSKAFGSGGQFSWLATDPAGNIYGTGHFEAPVDFGGGAHTPLGTRSGFIVKFDASGVYQWSKGFGDAITTPRAVAIDPMGNVVATGVFNGSVDFGGGVIPTQGATDAYVVKLSSAGAHQWSMGFGKSGNQNGRAIVADASGNVYVEGEFSGTANFGGADLVSQGLNDTFLVKLSPAGAHLWSKRFGDAMDQTGVGVALDSAQNPVFTGVFSGTIDFGGASLTSQGGIDVFFAKFDPSGNHLWSKAISGASSQGLGTLTVDPADNVVIVGYAQGTVNFGGLNIASSAGPSDAFLAKYDVSGNLLWAKIFGDTAFQVGKTVATDPMSNIILAGFMLSGGIDLGGGARSGMGGEDTFIAKLAP